MARKLKNEDIFRDDNSGFRELREYLEKLKLSANELEEILLDFLEEGKRKDYEGKERKKHVH